MQFQHPNAILNLLWLLPAVLGLAWWGRGRRAKRLGALVASSDVAANLTMNVSAGRRSWRLALFCLGLALLVLAAARPQWGSHLVERPSRSRDILVLLDVSRSMLARDIKPGTRLDHAKWLLHELVKRTPGDRYGLIPFAGVAYLECPLTPNRDSFFLFLDDVDTDTVPVGGTNIARALEAAEKAFKAADGEHRGIVLVTDGEELQGDLRSRLDHFRERKIPIFVVGIGDPVIGSFIQTADNSFLTDSKGEMVRTTLNEAGLKDISAAVGGSYVRSTVVHDGLDHLARKVRSLVPGDAIDGGSRMQPIERYQIPLALALLCFVLRLGVGERRAVAAGPLRAGVLAAVWLGVGLALAASLPLAAQQLPPTPPPTPGPTPGQPPGPADPAAKAALESMARAAIAELEERLDAAEEPREKAMLHYNLGVNQQMLGNTEEAQKQYDDALNAGVEDPGLRSAAYQNLGVLKHREAFNKLYQDPGAALTEIKGAQEFYREALRTDPRAIGAAENQEIAYRHRKLAEEWQKLQKQLGDAQKEAREQTEKAHEQQRQANQEQRPQEKREQQKGAQEQGKAAQGATKKLAEQAKAAGGEEAAKQFQQAEQSLQEAQQQQQQASNQQATPEERQQAGKEAERKLAQALEELGGKPPEKGQEQEGGTPEQEGKDPESQQLAQGEEDPEPEGGKEEEAPSDFDKFQALSILAEMQQREKDWKEMEKRAQKRRRKQTVEKDW